ncbi:nuclear transport factor 2 family protein [Fulvivirga sedimenti]|uniref:Nuclear transport factor 2 family protein n=1 Tax=Fulvivirga sedimenti TaxID=2879465 RepID=A0A9X1L1S6_9BACT|nr:nuclear transport factor 2 family protein [Fulvivirga sedimenti]MCA6078542.1 nuclear transport factor 2 family protein [Fulvivirga sedimenti]
MKRPTQLFLFLFSLLLIFTGNLQAQTSTEEDAVRQACMNYIEGFYEGNTNKLKEALAPELNKFGFWKDDESGSFGEAIHMSYDQALDYAANVLAKKQFPASDAPRKVTILDVKEIIAAAKITAWWGEDYVLLSKKNGKWMIEQVLWEGPLTQSN